MGIKLCYFFSKLKINNLIITKFIDFYWPKYIEEETEESKLLSSQTLIPRTYETKRKLGNYDATTTPHCLKECDSYLATIAFLMANENITKMEEELKIIPSWLIREFEDKKTYSNILSRLILIEKNYENKDADAILKNSITLLENILDLNTEVERKGNISKKIKYLMGKENNEQLKKFGVKKEFMEAFNNFRIIRNTESVHTEASIKYDIPFLVAVSNAYLVILLLKFTLATGELIS